MTARNTRLHPWTRLNLVLAAMLIGLLTMQWTAMRPEPKRALFSIEPDRVEEIRVQAGPRLKLAIRRDGDGWRMTHPEDQPARAERVAQLLAVVRAPVHYSFAAPRDLSRYGLSPPAAVLQLEGAGMSRTELAFGDRDPAQNQRYVLADGEIRLIDDVFFSLLSLPANHFTAN